MDQHFHQVNDRVSRIVEALRAKGMEIEEDEGHPAVAQSAASALVVEEGRHQSDVERERAERLVRPAIRAKWEAGEMLSEAEARILFGSVPAALSRPALEALSAPVVAAPATEVVSNVTESAAASSEAAGPEAAPERPAERAASRRR